MSFKEKPDLKRKNLLEAITSSNLLAFFARLYKVNHIILTYLMEIKIVFLI
jgi:hypothetical protein